MKEKVKKAFDCLSQAQRAALVCGGVAVLAAVTAVVIWGVSSWEQPVPEQPSPVPTVALEPTPSPEPTPTAEPTAEPTPSPVETPTTAPAPKPSKAPANSGHTSNGSMTSEDTSQDSSSEETAVSGSYSCGVPGHPCRDEGDHLTITTNESLGCAYCGSHSCVSFYVPNPLGGFGNVEACPSYDAHKDPTKYCQTCGKPAGDGTNGTCTWFVHGCNCPLCGTYVEGNTCHSCS